MITLLMFLTCNPAGLMAEAWPHPITSAFPKRTIREFLFIEALQTRRPELCQLNSHGMQVKVGVFVCTVRYFISFQAALNLPGVHKSHVFTGFPRNRLHLMSELPPRTPTVQQDAQLFPRNILTALPICSGYYERGRMQHFCLFSKQWSVYYRWPNGIS